MPAGSVYLTPSAAHRRLGLVCLGVGRQAGSLRSVRDRVLTSQAVVLVEAGRGSVQVGDGPRREISGPMVFWVPAGVRHTYGPDRAGWSEWWVLFDGPDTDAYHRLGILRRAPSAGPASPLRHPFEQLLAAALRADDAQRQLAADLGVHQLLLAVARSRTGPSSDHGTVLSRLRSAALSDLRVRALAEELTLSVAELREIVRRETGYTPKQFIVQTRLNEAKVLLAGTDLPVARVAARVGYPDAGYFSRLFTRHVGVAPITFRDQQARGEGPPPPVPER